MDEPDVDSPLDTSDPPGCISFRIGVPNSAPLAPDVWRRLWPEVADAEPLKGYASPLSG
jgi:hypothetical protein